MNTLLKCDVTVQPQKLLFPLLVVGPKYCAKMDRPQD